MPQVQANEIQIEYETFGSPQARPLLLTMGLGGQMILWDEDFCEALAERGHYVVRYDNRDVGLSTKFEEAGEPDLASMMLDPAAALDDIDTYLRQVPDPLAQVRALSWRQQMHRDAGANAPAQPAWAGFALTADADDGAVGADGRDLGWVTWV